MTLHLQAAWPTLLFLYNPLARYTQKRSIRRNDESAYYELDAGPRRDCSADCRWRCTTPRDLTGAGVEPGPEDAACRSSVTAVSSAWSSDAHRSRCCIIIREPPTASRISDRVVGQSDGKTEIMLYKVPMRCYKPSSAACGPR